MSMARSMAKEGAGLRRWEAPLGFVLSCCGALFILMVSRLKDLKLPVPAAGDVNSLPTGGEAALNLDRFLGDVDWRCMIILEGVAAFFVTALAASVVREVWFKENRPWPRARAFLLISGLLLVLADAADIMTLWFPGIFKGLSHFVPGWLPSLKGYIAGIKHGGYLEKLFDALPGMGDSIRREAVWGRMLGEPFGLIIGVALYAVVTLPESAKLDELAKRNRQLSHLLYGASVLFVIGLLMARANFCLILAQWDWVGSSIGPDALKDLVEKGVKLAGVSYSCILAVFYLPARWILQRHIDGELPAGKRIRGTKEREEWLKGNGFTAGWREDLKQIFAVMAPVLAAPVFETLAK